VFLSTKTTALATMADLYAKKDEQEALKRKLAEYERELDPLKCKIAKYHYEQKKYDSEQGECDYELDEYYYEQRAFRKAFKSIFESRWEELKTKITIRSQKIYTDYMERLGQIGLTSEDVERAYVLTVLIRKIKQKMFVEPAYSTSTLPKV